MDLIKALNWRYAVKNFDADRKVDPALVAQLVEAARLTPTSLGLQPFRLVVVENPDLKAKLDGASFGQVQPGTCSHLFVFACLTNLDEAYADGLIDQMATERNMESGPVESFRGMVKGFMGRLSREDQTTWEDKQAYIGLGQVMTAAALLGVDTCPMEGFDPAQVDEILGLCAQNLRPVLLCPIGYRSEDDKYQHQKKLRLPTEDFARFMP